MNASASIKSIDSINKKTTIKSKVASVFLLKLKYLSKSVLNKLIREKTIIIIAIPIGKEEGDNPLCKIGGSSRNPIARYITTAENPMMDENKIILFFFIKNSHITSE